MHQWYQGENATEVKNPKDITISITALMCNISVLTFFFFELINALVEKTFLETCTIPLLLFSHVYYIKRIYYE